MASIRSFIEKQQDLFNRLSRSVDNLKKTGKEKTTVNSVNARIQLLESYWEKFMNNHEQLVAIRTDEIQKLPYFADDLYQNAEDAYFSNKEQLLELKEVLTESSAAAANVTVNDQCAHSSLTRSLPKVTLPKFSGDYHEWRTFRDLFHSMIVENSGLAAVEKLHYLKSSVTGEASRLLAHFVVTSDNFEPAWEALVARFENKRALMASYFDRLFDLQPLTAKSADSLNQLLATTRESIAGLSALGASKADAWDFFLVYFISRRLDRETLEAWELHQGNSTEQASFADLELFLNGRVRALELIAPQFKQRLASRGKATESLSKWKPPARAHSTNVQTTCAYCHASHYLASCPSFAQKTVAERQEFVQSKKLCYNCLGEHRLANCRITKCCRTCGSKHHTLIHQDRFPSNSANSSRSINQLPSTGAQQPNHMQPSISSAAASLPSGQSVHSCCVVPQSDVSRPTTILATALLRLADYSGQFVEARALLDQGSEISFISEPLAQALRLSRRPAAIPVLGIGSRTAGSTRGAVSLQIRPRDQPGEFTVTAYVLPKLTGRVPATRVNILSWPHLKGIDLADPTFATPGRIDIVLGADVYGFLLKNDVRRGPSSSPVAQLTSLGWIISGPAASSDHQRRATFAQQTFSTSLDLDLHELLTQFWKQETVPSLPAPCRSPDEEECENHFASTHSRTSTGRYVIRLPFRSKTLPLGESYSAAARMLHRLQQRLVTGSAFSQLYVEFLTEYQRLGHMSRVDPVGSCPNNSASLAGVYYLPHHGVLRESSSTTKLRVVFNGSMRTSTGFSLNDCLHTGPKLQRDLADVLLRWRRHAYVFLADIEKMYRQILVHSDDRDFQRILWSVDGPPQEYQLTTVTYGLACAPYLALKVIQQLAADEGSSYPLAVDVLKEDMYVDDVLSGGDTVDIARQKAQQVNELLMAGGFPLQKWKTNDRRVLGSLPGPTPESTEPCVFAETALTRALGLSWSPSLDAFVFNLRQDPPPKTLTKRIILSRIAQMFDPLGWITPVLITAKILMQRLWKEDLGWDDPLPATMGQAYLEYEQSLSVIPSFSIPRWTGLSSDALAVEIHGFSDASQEALGAAVYIRVLNELDDVRVTLLTAKSKVAPLSKQTIPRLELSAAVLLVKLVMRVCSVLRLSEAPVHLWVDSSVVLTWIKKHPSELKEFVANRVSYLQESLPRARWHYVSGSQNPADCASRGLTPEALFAYDGWWSGPAWLSRPSTSWNMESPPLSQTIDLELRPGQAHAATISSPPPLWDLIERYSSLRRLLRVTALIIRAVGKFKKVPTPEPLLSPGDLSHAKTFWIKHVQEAYFEREIQTLSKGGSLPRSHPFLRLAPFVDADGVIRVGGRLRNAQLDPDAKHPILLPRNGTLTTLVISDAHQRTLHGGVQLVLVTIRQQYWILGGRAPISAFVRRCIRCARFRAETAKEMMGQLPAVRVTPSRPFLTTGVDYAGPFTIKTWRGRAARTYKGFLVVFVCLTTSAVHLELATDYSTQGFLAAYRRFASRRGLCSTLISDCGTNFVGADAELKRLFSAASAELSELASTLASDGTTWKFNPPSAPHFGGKWEAAVKSVKFHIKRVIGDTQLTYEEFATLLHQIEAVLNSRPLCPLSDDPADIEALTPAHFLVGEPLSALPEPSLEEVPRSRLSRWQHLHQLLHRFWRRWSTDYLQRLQEISKWQNASNSINVGSLVLIADERYPPSKWPLARVVETHAGADGRIRVVTVQTANSRFKRPIVKLCVLPVDSTEPL